MDSTFPQQIGRYEVQQVLGQGAMGRVLLAHDPILDRDVALKMLRSDLELSPEMREGLQNRMRNEARAVARVAHPNIVTLHDTIEHETLGLCLVFELVGGATLESMVRLGPLPLAQVIQLSRELGSALTVAHAAGVLHRDIKPENVMKAPFGFKITDFGIARVPDSTLTRMGGLLGTPAYSAPETVKGENFSPASDQFSLAATLYEAISGKRAFPGDDAFAVAARIRTDPVLPIAAALGLDPDVDVVLNRALSKQANKRYPTCEEFTEDLAAALSRAAVASVLPIPRSVSARPSPTPPRAIGLYTSVAIGLVASLTIVILLIVAAAKGPSPSALEIVSARGETEGGPDASSHDPVAPTALPAVNPGPSATATAPTSASNVKPSGSSAPLGSSVVATEPAATATTSANQGVAESETPPLP